MERCGARVIDPRSPEYPPLLRRLRRPPRLYVVGGELPRGVAVAVAGARDADGYGLSVAYEVGRRLAEAGVAVATGLAHGVDAAAADGASSAGGAVVGVPPSLCVCGALRWEVRRLLGRGGVAISEHLATSDVRRALAARNWIVVGMSAALIVPYARYRERGWGTAVAVRAALSLGRPVVVIRPPEEAPDDVKRGYRALRALGAAVAETAEEAVERALGAVPRRAGTA
jgi:DNA processing protein